jgi:hypothetical protein
MTRSETEHELEELRAQIRRLESRAAFLATRLARSDEDGVDSLPRPGWPIQRAQTSGRRISTSAPPRIAV